jgi:hypothetical protein
LVLIVLIRQRKRGEEMGENPCDNPPDLIDEMQISRLAACKCRLSII